MPKVEGNEKPSLDNLRLQILKTYQLAAEQSFPGISVDPKRILSQIMADGGSIGLWRPGDYNADLLAALAEPTYKHRGFEYDPLTRNLKKPGDEVLTLTKIQGTLFHILIARAGEIVPNPTIQNVVGDKLGWGAPAEMQYIIGFISRLRRRIGDVGSPEDGDEARHKYIKTKSGVGYSFDPPALTSLIPVEESPRLRLPSGEGPVIGLIINHVPLEEGANLDDGSTIEGSYRPANEAGDAERHVCYQPEIYPIWLTKYILANKKDEYRVSNVTHATGRQGAAPTFVDLVRRLAGTYGINVEQKPLLLNPRVFAEICREIGPVNRVRSEAIKRS